MKAFGFTGPFSQDKQNYVEQLDVATPTPIGHDILVEVKAVGINPVDTKVRERAAATPSCHLVLTLPGATRVFVRAANAETLPKIALRN